MPTMRRKDQKTISADGRRSLGQCLEAFDFAFRVMGQEKVPSFGMAIW